METTIYVFVGLMIMGGGAAILAAVTKSSNLIPCEDCGNLISNKAVSCPKCGCPGSSLSPEKINPSQILDKSTIASKKKFSWIIKNKNNIQASVGVTIIVIIGFSIFKLISYEPKFYEEEKTSKIDRRRSDTPSYFSKKASTPYEKCFLQVTESIYRTAQATFSPMGSWRQVQATASEFCYDSYNSDVDKIYPY